MLPTWRKQFIRYRSFLLNIVSHYRRRKDLMAYLEIFLSLATISAFSIFALRPTLITISELITEIESKKESIVFIDEKITNLGRAQQLYERERSKIELLDNAIPDSAKPDILAFQFEGISSDNQIPLSQLTISESVVKGVSNDQVDVEQKESSIDFVFQTSADYSKIIQTISNIQNLRRILNVSSVSLNTPDDGSQIIDLTISGKSIFIPVKK